MNEVFRDEKSINLRMLLLEHKHFLFFFTASRIIKKQSYLISPYAMSSRAANNAT
jgi:hypothetical protein